MLRQLQCAVVATLLFAAGLCYAEQQGESFADKFVVHYAGMLGMISLGVENSAGHHTDYQFLAGYTPASEAGVDIYSLGFRANYVFDPLLRKERLTARLYTGLGIYYYLGKEYQTYDYPEGYYTPPGVEWHWMPYLGIRFSGIEPLRKEVTLYAEAGVIDFYLHHYYNNHRTLGLSDVISFALGVTIPLH